MFINFIKSLFKPKSNTKSGTTVEAQKDTAAVKESGADKVIELPVQEHVIKQYEGINFHILLDNGHAMSTPGKRQQLENGRHFFEYEFNREIVRRIAERLDNMGIPYEILVPEVEEDIPLSDRAARANSFCSKYGTNNCFLISVHSNAYGDGITFTKAKGWSIYTTKGNTKSDSYATEIFNVAEEVLPEYGFTTRKDTSDGDPDYEENYTIIYKTWCPAVLTENLFFTNKEEVRWLMSDRGRDAIADIHVKGIERIIRSRTN